MAASQLVNVSNFAAFGVEWYDGGGTRIQLGNYVGTTHLFLGMKVNGNPWSQTKVVNPERFGLIDPPKTFAQFRAIALNFIGANH